MKIYTTGLSERATDGSNGRGFKANAEGKKSKEEENNEKEEEEEEEGNKHSRGAVKRSRRTVKLHLVAPSLRDIVTHKNMMELGDMTAGAHG